MKTRTTARGRRGDRGCPSADGRLRGTPFSKQACGKSSWPPVSYITIGPRVGSFTNRPKRRERSTSSQTAESQAASSTQKAKVIKTCRFDPRARARCGSGLSSVDWDRCTSSQPTPFPSRGDRPCAHQSLGFSRICLHRWLTVGATATRVGRSNQSAEAVSKKPRACSCRRALLIVESE